MPPRHQTPSLTILAPNTHVLGVLLPWSVQTNSRDTASRPVIHSATFEFPMNDAEAQTHYQQRHTYCSDLNPLKSACCSSAPPEHQTTSPSPPPLPPILRRCPRDLDRDTRGENQSTNNPTGRAVLCWSTFYPEFNGVFCFIPFQAAPGSCRSRRVVQADRGGCDVQPSGIPALANARASEGPSPENCPHGRPRSDADAHGACYRPSRRCHAGRPT